MVGEGAARKRGFHVRDRTRASEGVSIVGEICAFLKRFYLFIFREKGREGEKHRLVASRTHPN